MSEVKTASFTVEGSFITGHHRDLCLEGSWQKALRDLCDCLQGLTLDQAIKVLSGKAKFTGIDSRETDGILFEDDDAKEYIKEIEDMFGNCFSRNGFYYAPYAVVTDYGPGDRKHNDKSLERVPEFMHRDKKLDLRDFQFRAMFYAENPSTDFVETHLVHNSRLKQAIEMNVLFKRVANPPLWLAPFKNSRETVKASKNLYDRGHVHVFGDGEDTNSIKERCIDFGANADLVGQTTPAYEDNTPDIDLSNPDAMGDYNEKQLERLSMPQVPSLDEYLSDAKRANIALDDIEGLRVKILKQTNGDFYEHTFTDVGTVKIPKVPLFIWAISRADKFYDKSNWDTVSPRGMKSGVDDPYHTDWMVGAGIDLKYYSPDHEFFSEQMELLYRIQEDYTGSKTTILCATGGPRVGETLHPEVGDIIPRDTIIIIPNASVKYYELAQQACLGGGGVIVEQGGAMAHLAVVGIEEKFTIVRIENARKKFREGILVAINTMDKRLELMAERM